MGDGNGDVVCIGGDHLGRGGAIADKEVKDTGGDDGALGNAGVDHLEGGRDGEVEAGSFPATEVGEKPADPVGVKRRV